MSSDKKNGEDKGFLSGVASGFIGSIKNIFKKEDAAYDDGYGYDSNSEDDGKARFMYIVMSVYGAIAGFIGCQYCKYLHQRFACRAWGIPLTSRPVSAYSVTGVIVDMVAFFVVYAAVLGLGTLINRIMKILMEDKMRNATESANIALAYGFAFMVIVSVIFFFVRFNIFLLGVD